MTAGRAKLWILTRKHPPAVGGMEELSKRLVEQLQRRGPVEVVSWGRSQLGLPYFLAKAAVALLAGLVRRRVSSLLIGDPALAILGRLATLWGVPVACVVHGLDVTWPNAVYQAYLRAFFWRRFHAYVCISRHTAGVVLAKGVPRERVFVVPVGVSPAVSAMPADVDGDPVLLLVGRLVPRKGACWFVRFVLPRLVAAFPALRLVIVGTGPERARIETAAREGGTSDRIKMTGGVGEREKWALLARCDAVVVPNIPIDGDVEGFGIVALEAGAAGKPVFAADLEGLRDAVSDGVNGWRLPPGDAAAWAAAMGSRLLDRPRLLAQGEIAREHVMRNFDWELIGDRYAAILERLPRSL